MSESVKAAQTLLARRRGGADKTHPFATYRPEKFASVGRRCLVVAASTWYQGWTIYIRTLIRSSGIDRYIGRRQHTPQGMAGSGIDRSDDRATWRRYLNSILVGDVPECLRS